MPSRSVMTEHPGSARANIPLLSNMSARKRYDFIVELLAGSRRTDCHLQDLLRRRAGCVYEGVSPGVGRDLHTRNATGTPANRRKW